MPRLLSYLVAALLFWPTLLAAETRLLMAEQIGCHWCEKWDQEIGHIYPKTQEGKVAPLGRYDLHQGTPEGVTLSRRVSFTPTFLLLEDGKEVGRLEGYPGEDLFWSMLKVMFDRADVRLETSG